MDLSDSRPKLDARWAEARRPDITDFSYMSGPDNNIPIDECESERSWATLRALLITHYKYAKLNHLIRWVTYKKPVNE